MTTYIKRPQIGLETIVCFQGNLGENRKVESTMNCALICEPFELLGSFQFYVSLLRLTKQPLK